MHSLKLNLGVTSSRILQRWVGKFLPCCSYVINTTALITRQVDSVNFSVSHFISEALQIQEKVSGPFDFLLPGPGTMLQRQEHLEFM